jgi:hypothetical protein
VLDKAIVLTGLLSLLLDVNDNRLNKLADRDNQRAASHRAKMVPARVREKDPTSACAIDEPVF